MTKVIAAAMMMAVLTAGTAYAASAYTWTGMGTNVQGSSKCTTYKMTINVTVDGTSVKGQFQQQGRDERHFEATLDGKGVFKTKAQVGGGGSMDVSGTISDAGGQVLLDGYCKFQGKLTRN
jgi:hypothetical protein